MPKSHTIWKGIEGFLTSHYKDFASLRNADDFERLVPKSTSRDHIRFITNMFYHAVNTIHHVSGGWLQSSRAEPLDVVANIIDVSPLGGEISGILGIAAKIAQRRYEANCLTFAHAMAYRFSPSETETLSMMFAYLLVDAYQAQLQHLTEAGVTTFFSESVNYLLKNLIEQQVKFTIPVNVDGPTRLAHVAHQLFCHFFTYNNARFASVVETTPTLTQLLDDKKSRRKRLLSKTWTVPGLQSRVGVILFDDKDQAHYFTYPDAAKHHSRPEKYSFIYGSTALAEQLGLVELSPDGVKAYLNSEVGQLLEASRAKQPALSIIGAHIVQQIQAQPPIVDVDPAPDKKNIKALRQQIIELLAQHDNLAQQYNQRVKSITHVLNKLVIPTSLEHAEQQLQQLLKPINFITTIYQLDINDMSQPELEANFDVIQDKVNDLLNQKLQLLTRYLGLSSELYAEHPSIFAADPDVLALLTLTENSNLHREELAAPDSDVSQLIDAQVDENAWADRRLYFDFKQDRQQPKGSDYFVNDDKAAYKLNPSQHKPYVSKLQNIWQDRHQIRELARIIEKGGDCVSRARRENLAYHQKKLATAMEMYFALGGKSLGPMALSNHPAFVDGCVRSLGKVAKAFYRLWYGANNKALFDYNLSQAQQREAFLAEQVKESNVRTIENYWVQGINKLVTRHPKETARYLLTNYDKCAHIRSYLPDLLPLFPAKQQRKLQARLESAPEAEQQVRPQMH